MQASYVAASPLTEPCAGFWIWGALTSPLRLQAPVLQFWKAFDLDSKRVALDSQGSAMKTEKEASVRSRKKLAETTKNFRRLADADKVAAVGGLLRAYQEEVDSLTRRAKFSENAFFMLYKELYAAPDPVASLEIVADMKVADIEEENKKLRRELRDYETEFASLKNQDITIRKLEEQLNTSTQEMDNAIHEQVEKRTQELEALLEAKQSELSQQKMNYERQLESSRAELREAFSRLDAMQSDLFEHKQRSGLAKSTLDVEMEAISQEAILMQTLQLENNQLKKQLDDLLSTSSMPFSSTDSSLARDGAGSHTIRERHEQDDLIATLRQEVLQLKEDLVHANAATAMEKARLEKEIRANKQTISELEQTLASRPTTEQYTDVVRQLRVFQQLEYNIVDEDDDSNANADSSNVGDAGDGIVPSDVEKVLLSRVRRLEHSLHQRELELQERANELQIAAMELEAKRAKIDEQAALVRTLEETVASLEKARKSMGLLPSGGGSGDMGSEILLDAVEDHLASSSNDLNVLASSTSSNSVMGDSDSKMLEIVRGQRDRFRERMKELQSEKTRVEELAQSYKSSVARLENDNMQLYHKIRYLQSYRSSGSGGGGSRGANHRVAPGAHAMAGSLEDGSMGGGGDVEAKYRSIYEEKMNPFVQFNKMETQQRYTNLNVVDKILLNSARLFLGHRITRNIAFGYILLLHLLVFATLYTFMHGCGISNE